MICPETCPHRLDVRERNKGEVATCDLLRQIVGVEESTFCEVHIDACKACCRQTPSVATRINPVVASLLFDLSGRIIDVGGVTDCDVGKAAGIKRWAEQNLLWLDTEEEDEDLTKFFQARKPDGCIHLGASNGARSVAATHGDAPEPVFACGHENHDETTLADCYHCCDWTDQANDRPAPLAKLIPAGEKRCGPKIRNWAVGVTTAPRQHPTLEWCLDSLIRAGWSRPRLFVDTPVEIAGRHSHLPVSLRQSRLGAWPNYYLSLMELLMRAPHADAYLLVQDDVIVYDEANVREYLEEVLWPGDDVGAASLYCSKAYTHEESGWHAYDGHWVWGALAFVFSREAAKQFVTNPLVLEHRWKAEGLHCANIDTVVGEWALRDKLPIYFPTPSLTQHIGDVSTLWPAGRAKGMRLADRFVGDARGT